MNAVRGVYQFLYDFIVGDDWKIAAGVVTSLGVGVVLVDAGAATLVVVVTSAALVVATFALALVIDVRGPGD